METAATKATLLKRLEGLHQIPTLPAVLAPLLRYLQQPLEQLDVQKVTDMIAQDKSLAAQCLQMANSPLFGRWQKIDSLRAAIVGLGFQRVSDIAMSCSVLNLMPSNNGLDPVAFWEHSLGCALVCRHFARKISYPDPGKAYLAGLLHDLGIIVNLWVLPKEFAAAFELGRSEGVPLDEAEQRILGFTHCESGRLLAERWELSRDLIEVVSLHHTPEQARDHAGLVALVELSDLLCRVSGLNHGYIEKREVNLLERPSCSVLAEQCQQLKDFDWARLTFELDSYMDEVHALVHAIYRT
ncbi:MAG TPA: HDOD domain-containing protein [Candidatus Acidoferrales bacterium]|nr:HDOD domain-containing protein [Candidatus Acidoferrales bacterium]